MRVRGPALPLLALLLLPLMALGDSGAPALEDAGRAFRDGDLERAIDTLETVIAADPPGVYRAWHLLGRVQLLRGRPPEAETAFAEVLARAPRFAPASLGLAEARLAQGRFGEAASVLEELVSRLSLPAPLRREAALYIAAATKAPESAEAEILRGLDQDLGAASAYAALGLLRTRLRNPEGAADAFRVALALDDRHGLARTLLGRLAGDPAPLHEPLPGLERLVARVAAMVDSGAAEAAIAGASEILGRRERHVPARVLRARARTLSGDLWGAVADYREVLDATGPIPSIAEALGRIALSMEAWSLAACSLEPVAELRPDSGEVRYLLGKAESGAGRVDPALEHFRAALRLGHDPARSWLEVGELLFERMEISASLDAYRNALEADPEAAEVIRPFALATLTAEQSATLRQLLETHLAAHPENLDTLYALASLALAEGELELAESRFRRLAERAPDRPQVHYNLGQVLLRRGETAEGRAEMERFRELKEAEDREWERHNRAHFRRVEAEEAREAGDPLRAVALYRQSVEEGTATRDDERALATALSDAGRPAEALPVYARLLDAAPADEEALRGLARAAGAAGRADLRTSAERKVDLLAGCAW